MRATGTPAAARAANEGLDPGGIDGQKQPAGGLGVIEQVDQVAVHAGGDADASLEVLTVGPTASRNIPAHESTRAVEQGHPARLDLQRTPARRRHLGRVTDEPEAGDVGARVHGAPSCRTITSAAARFRVVIDRTAAAMAASGARLNFSAVAMMPVPSGLVRNSTSPGCAPAFASTRAGSIAPVTA